MRKLLNIEYAGVQATHWMYFGVIGSFASVFLLANGYANSDIGLILALGNVLAVVLQPIVADVADRSKKISVIGITELMTIAIILLTSILFILKGNSLALSALYILLVGGFTSIQPLINSLAFVIEKKGLHINFGVARSMGSLAYAVLCAVLGSIIDKFGIITVPVSSELVLIMFLLSLVLINYHFKKAQVLGEKNEEELILEEKQALKAEEEVLRIEEEEISLREFSKRNGLFLVINVGIACLFYGNSILNNFMIQIVDAVGGNEVDMGRIIGAMAALEIPTMVLFDQINKKISCSTLLKVAAVGFCIKMTLCYVATSVFTLYLAQIAQLFAFALLLPAMVHFIDEIMTKGEAVKGQALFTASTTVGGVFASISGGWILDLSSANMLLLVSTTITIIGTIIIIPFVGKVKKGKRI